MMIVRRFLFAALAVAPGFARAAEPPRADCVAAGKPARLGGCVHRTDATGNARVFFRDAGERHWYFVEATNENGCATGVIPAPGARLERVAYYVEVATADGQLERSRERSVRVVRSADQCHPGRLVPSSAVEPSFVGATAGAPLAPRRFGPQAAGGGAPGWVMGSAAAAAAGGTAVALRGDGGHTDGATETASAAREPSPAATVAPPPPPTPTPEPPPPPPRQPTPTPAPVDEPAPEPPPSLPVPTLPPLPTVKPTATPKPTETPKPTATPKPRRDRDHDDDDFSSATLEWNSDLQAPGARGRLSLASPLGPTIDAAAGRVQGALVLRSGEQRLEMVVGDTRGPGVWRVTLSGQGLVPGSLRLVSGAASIEGSHTIVIPIRARPGEAPTVVAFRAP